MLLLPLHEMRAERQLQRARDEGRVEGGGRICCGKSDLGPLGMVSADSL
jgi:hypothetical protein